MRQLRKTFRAGCRGEADAPLAAVGVFPQYVASLLLQHVAASCSHAGHAAACSFSFSFLFFPTLFMQRQHSHWRFDWNWFGFLVSAPCPLSRHATAAAASFKTCGRCRERIPLMAAWGRFRRLCCVFCFCFFFSIYLTTHQRWLTQPNWRMFATDMGWFTVERIGTAGHDCGVNFVYVNVFRRASSQIFLFFFSHDCFQNAHLAPKVSADTARVMKGI